MNTKARIVYLLFGMTMFAVLFLTTMTACATASETENTVEQVADYEIKEVTPGLFKITTFKYESIDVSGTGYDAFGHIDAFDRALKELAESQTIIFEGITPIQYWQYKGSFTKELLVPVELR